MTNIHRISVLGVPIDLFTASEFVTFLAHSASREKKKTVVGYANVHEMNLAHDLPTHWQFLRQADAVFLDGFGVMIGAKLLGHKVARRHRLTGPEFLDALVLACADNNLSLYLLGGEQATLDAAISKMGRVAPSVTINGHHGYFQKIGPENNAVISDINSKSPDILYVGLGSPKQEDWISENMKSVNARVFLPMGAGLDHYTGMKSRGPRWLTDNGAEWLFRLAVEPQRLWKRYLIGNPRFFARIFGTLAARARDLFAGTLRDIKVQSDTKIRVVARAFMNTRATPEKSLATTDSQRQRPQS